MAAGTCQSGSGPHAVRNYPPRQSARLGRARISPHAFAPAHWECAGPLFSAHGRREYTRRRPLTILTATTLGSSTAALAHGGHPRGSPWLPVRTRVDRTSVAAPTVSLGESVLERKYGDFSKRGDRRRHQLIGGCGGAKSPGRVRPPAVHTPDDARNAAGMHGSAADSGEARGPLVGKLVSWKASGGLRTAVRVRRPKHVRHVG